MKLLLIKKLNGMREADIEHIIRRNLNILEVEPTELCYGDIISVDSDELVSLLVHTNIPVDGFKCKHVKTSIKVIFTDQNDEFLSETTYGILPRGLHIVMPYMDCENDIFTDVEQCVCLDCIFESAGMVKKVKSR